MLPQATAGPIFHAHINKGKLSSFSYRTWQVRKGPNVLPRNDLTADTYRLLASVVEGVRSGVNDLAGDLVGPAAVVPQAADAHAEVGLSHGDGLAVVERFDGGKQVKILLEEIRELHEQLAAVLWGLFPPWTIESLAGG